MMETKVCTSCNTEKPLADYSTNGLNGLHTRCRKCGSEHEKRHRLENIEKCRARDKENYLKHKEKKDQRSREYYAANKEKKLAAEKQRYAKNAEKIKEATRSYRKENMHKVYALNGKRRARCKLATPAWANLDEIANIYQAAKVATETTGIVHHVDHFYPLMGKLVSGLHVEANLRVITKQENLAKSSKVLNV